MRLDSLSELAMAFCGVLVLMFALYSSISVINLLQVREKMTTVVEEMGYASIDQNIAIMGRESVIGYPRMAYPPSFATVINPMRIDTLEALYDEGKFDHNPRAEGNDGWRSSYIMSSQYTKTTYSNEDVVLSSEKLKGIFTECEFLTTLSDDGNAVGEVRFTGTLLCNYTEEPQEASKVSFSVSFFELTEDGRRNRCCRIVIDGEYGHEYDEMLLDLVRQALVDGLLTDYVSGAGAKSKYSQGNLGDYSEYSYTYLRCVTTRYFENDCWQVKFGEEHEYELENNGSPLGGGIVWSSLVVR